MTTTLKATGDGSLKKLTELEKVMVGNCVIFLKEDNWEGWCIYNPKTNLVTPLDCGQEPFCMGDDRFWEGALARFLVAGEVLHVKYTGE